MEPKTEDQIERWVEMMMDRLDMKYSTGRLTEEEYNEEVRKISKQADKYYESSDVNS
jgi:3-hydroxyacyl-CoA dehydrogenase